MSDTNLYEKILVAVQLRKYDFAFKMTQEILAKNPQDDAAYMILGLIYFAKNEYDKAIDAIQEAISFAPSEVSYYAKYCMVLCHKMQYKKALEVSDEGLMIDPTDTDLMYWRGFALWKLGKVDRAENITEYLLKKNPNDEYNHNLLANIYVEKDKLKDAKLEFQKALEINPNNAIIYNDFAVMKLDNEENKEDESIAMLQESLRLEPEDKTAQTNLKYAIQSKKFKWFFSILPALSWILLLIIIVLFHFYPIFGGIFCIILNSYIVIKERKENKKTEQKYEYFVDKMAKKYKWVAVLLDIIFWLTIVLAVFLVLVIIFAYHKYT